MKKRIKEIAGECGTVVGGYMFCFSEKVEQLITREFFGFIVKYGGKKIRALTIVDIFTRECLAIDVDFSLRGEHVVAALERLRYKR